MSDDNSNGRDLKRRDFLGAVGGAGAAGVLGAGAITPAEAREAANEVEQLTGYDRWYQIQRARWNDEVGDLFERFAEEGKGPRVSLGRHSDGSGERRERTFGVFGPRQHGRDG